MEICSDMTECSIVVCTYNPNWEKLYLTLQSVFMQDDCTFQIVVTDDGSEENYFDRIREYFTKHSFDNYKLIANMQNHGTVYNILQGIRACNGELVKPLSPGDFLHGRHALRQWVDYMQAHEEYAMSYCDAIYYKTSRKSVVPMKMISHPQNKMPNAKQYIVYGDFCLGASALVRRQIWLNYLEKLQGKVIYAEDFSYQLMLYCGDKIINIPKPFLMYEYGSGISTSGLDFWAKKLREDNEAICHILLSSKPGKEVEKFNIDQYLKIPKKRTWWCRLKRVMFCPGKIIFRFKTVFFPRKTSMEVDEEFLKKMFN